MIFFYLFTAVFAYADLFEGRVVGIADGDTLTVLRADRTQKKVRLLGIDAPEKNQDFGKRSKEALTAKVAGQQVRVEFKKKDKYGRILGKVFLGESDINLGQIEDGLAWHYSHYSRDQFLGDALKYSQAQHRAREGKIGLWVLENPMAPWDFRHSRKSPSAKRRRGGRH